MNDKEWYAQFSAVAYAKPDEAPQNIDGYTLSLSHLRIKVYSSANGHILCLRGTKPGKSNDIKADVGIFFNNLSNTKVYHNVKTVGMPYIQSGMPVVCVGHSLGGALAIQMLRDFPDKITKVYAYNPGISPMEISVCFTNKCRISKKALKTKLQIYTTGFDPISIMAFIKHPGQTSLSAPTSFNTHSMSNFTSNEVMHDEEPRGAGISLAKPNFMPLNKDIQLKRNKQTVFDNPTSYKVNTSDYNQHHTYSEALTPTCSCRLAKHGQLTQHNESKNAAIGGKLSRRALYGLGVAGIGSAAIGFNYLQRKALVSAGNQLAQNYRYR